MNIKTLEVGSMKANCHLVWDHETKECLIIDPGDDSEYITSVILRESLIPVALIATHGHFDHVLAAFEIQTAFEIPFYIHADDSFLLSRIGQSAEHFLGLKGAVAPQNVTTLTSEPEIGFVDNLNFKILKTPGHTPGSISLYNKKSETLIVGDVIFADGFIGRTDFSYCSKKVLFDSINFLLQLPETTIVYPGHGEKTTIKDLKKFQYR